MATAPDGREWRAEPRRPEVVEWARAPQKPTNWYGMILRAALVLVVGVALGIALFRPAPQAANTAPTKLEAISSDPRGQLFTKHCRDLLSVKGTDVPCRAEADRRVLIITSPRLTHISALKFMSTQRRAVQDAGFDTISFWNGKKLPDAVYAENFVVDLDRAAQQVRDFSRPAVPHPSFRMHTFDVDLGISYVVPVGTTDEQLRSLLWFFREKVRTHHFREIGITRPPATRDGKPGYDDGFLAVYRGDRCAEALSFNYRGPCDDNGTYGEAAGYSWGNQADDPCAECRSPDHDDGYIRAAGKTIQVFHYTDNWQPGK
jgi:hypothetical protein